MFSIAKSWAVPAKCCGRVDTHRIIDVSGQPVTVPHKEEKREDKLDVMLEAEGAEMPPPAKKSKKEKGQQAKGKKSMGLEEILDEE